MARIYFAGAEKIETLRDLVTNGVEHVLFSYFYLRRRGQADALFQLLEEYPNTKVFLDSGAYSFRMANMGRFHDVTPQSYFDGYRAFVREFGHRFVYAVELDIDGIGDVTEDTVYRWREQLIDIGTVPIIPVWHKHRGHAVWDTWCQDPRTPHLGMTFYQTSIGERAQLVNRAHGFGKTIHGFAETKILTALKYIKYDTIDSTSWMAGTQYGIVYIFKGRQWIVLEKQHKKERRQYARYFRAIGCEPAGIIADNSDEVTKANIIAWRNLSDRFVTMHRGHVDEGITVKRRDGTIAYARSTEPRATVRRDGSDVRIISRPTASARDSLRPEEPVSACPPAQTAVEEELPVE